MDFAVKADEGKASGKYDEGILVPPAAWGEENIIAESVVLEGFKVDIKEIFK